MPTKAAGCPCRQGRAAVHSTLISGLRHARACGSQRQRGPAVQAPERSSSRPAGLRSGTVRSTSCGREQRRWQSRRERQAQRGMAERRCCLVCQEQALPCGLLAPGCHPDPTVSACGVTKRRGWGSLPSLSAQAHAPGSAARCRGWAARLAAPCCAGRATSAP